MKQLLQSILSGKRIAILGFGREGKSTYKLFREYFPNLGLTILDVNPRLNDDPALLADNNLNLITGSEYMQMLGQFDVVIKSPGIPSNTLPNGLNNTLITSQSDIFLQKFGNQTIGITGTKGKSTTSSLIYHIHQVAGRDSLLVGNIGVPPFDCINEINSQTTIVMELSSHQLEFVSHAPHIAILLNLFQEHLDHYYTYAEYQSAKFNIGRYQSDPDYFIYNSDNETLMQLIKRSGKLRSSLLPISVSEHLAEGITINNNKLKLTLKGETHFMYNLAAGITLPGTHNLYNVMAASAASFLNQISTSDIQNAVSTFKGLEHRIEWVGEYAGINWYNDSIATIPEAAMEAIKSLKNVNTLILGGFDRGIDYSILYPFLRISHVKNIIFVGQAGERMLNEFGEHDGISFSQAGNYEEVVSMAAKLTQPGTICLLSPAAASYDMFRNFEERGNAYKKYVRALPSHT